MDTGTKLLVEDILAQRENVGFAFKTEAIYKPKPVYDFFKRLFDVVCSLLALSVLWPFLLIIMLLIYLSDGGNPIFAQERPGKGGKLFKIYKLRTMVVGAEMKRQEVVNSNGSHVTVMYKSEDDPRITKFGAFLRKTSIDELVQCVNVLKGDMSVIGPRPMPLSDYVKVIGYFDRSVVKPGLSCYTVLDKHCRDSYENWVNLDIKYIRERSFGTDLKIIFKTIAAMVLCRNL